MQNAELIIVGEGSPLPKTQPSINRRGGVSPPEKMENKLPKRKQIRLPKHNYSAPGAYFITICTHNRSNTLSRIVGEGSPLPENYAVDLLPQGKIVDMVIKSIPQKYNDVNVDAYVVMPNHIHMLLSKKSYFGRGDPSPTTGTNIIDLVGWFKFICAEKINTLSNRSVAVFQRSFYDHIIRDQRDYDDIVRYIAENPINWEQDHLYTKR